MRAKRSKQYRKLMHQYALHFNFREPYQVLLTANLIRDAAACKMQLGNMLQNTLHGNIKPLITQCSIRHLYNFPIDETSPAQRSEKEAWIRVAKEAERRRCGHHELELPLSEEECVMSVVDPKGSGNNRHRYVVGVQELGVRERLRAEVAGVPLVYVRRSVMILEPMAEKSVVVGQREERGKVRAGLLGKGVKRKRDVGEDKGGEEVDGEKGEEREIGEVGQMKKTKKAKGPKGPNPLSVKKSKSSNAGKSERPVALEKSDAGEITVDGTAKRKRKRIRPSSADPALVPATAGDE